MMKIIFLGTPDFAVESLKELNEDKDISVELVISQKDKKRNRGKVLPTPVKQYAIDSNLRYITPENINDQNIIEEITEINPDLIVVVAYGQIIGDELLATFKDRIINLHSSILPKYRGAAPINWAIIEGDSESGATIMLVEKGLDTGDILNIEKISIDEHDTAQELHDKIKIIGARNLVDVVNNYEYFYKNRTKQDEKLSSYRGILKKSMGEIDWKNTPKDIYNKFRGMYPWPGSFFYLDNKMIKVHDMESINENHHHNPGKVVSVDEKGIIVAVNKGYILIKKIQFPNKKALDVSEYLKGNRFEIGIELGGR